nr:hypothetical protein [Tanacetum cinerariifolium]
MKLYSSETGVWCVCDIQFPPLCFFAFENGICWNNAIHWLHNGKLHFKLDIADHPVLTNLQTLGFLDGKVHWDSKLCESRGCLLLVYMELPDSLFDVYEMRNESSGWLLKYTINLDDTIQFPDEWKVSSGVCCILLEDGEEDSFMMINILGEDPKAIERIKQKEAVLQNVTSKSESDQFQAMVGGYFKDFRCRACLGYMTDLKICYLRFCLHGLYLFIFVVQVLYVTKMPNTRSRASMTHEEVEELVARRVAKEIEAHEAARNLETLNENEKEQEGENGGNEGNENGGNGENGNHGMKYGGFMPMARECTFQDFLKFAVYGYPLGYFPSFFYSQHSLQHNPEASCPLT